MSAEDFASSVTLFEDSTQDGVIAAPAVVLPHADSRQPQSDGALGPEQPITPGVGSTQIGNLQTQPTFASGPPNKKFKTFHSGASTSEGPEGGVIKRERIRGTRGRGDPRNARMKEERLRAQMAFLEKANPTSRNGLQQQTIAVRGRGRTTFNEGHSTATRYGVFGNWNIPNENFMHPKRAPASERRTPQQQILIDIHGPPSSTGRRNNRFQRPPFSPVMNRPAQGQQGPDHRRPGDDWTQWIELGVKLTGLPPSVTTFDLWQSFRHEGSIATVEIFEDNQGMRDGKGRLRFSPPPAKPFWQATKYQIRIKGVKHLYLINVELDAKRRLFLATSPVNPSVKYPENTILHAESIDFGFMYDAVSMMRMSAAHHTYNVGITFMLNLLRREIDIQFQFKIEDPRFGFIKEQRAQGKEPTRYKDLGKHNRYDNLRFRIPLAQLQVVHEIRNTDETREFLITLEAPPNFYRKTGQIEETHHDSALFWKDWDAWYRQTDVVYSPKDLRSAPLTLKKSRSIIDIGRWTTYRLVFNTSKNDSQKYDTIRAALRDYNIEIMPFPDFKLLTDPEPAVWSYINRVTRNSTKAEGSLRELTDDTVAHLSFPVRYQLEVCISQGCLNEHNLSKEFVDKLADMDEAQAKDVLEYVASQKRRWYNPMEIFKIKIIKGSASRLRIPHYCAYTRSAVITPTTVYFNTPTVETSNRVVRQYIEHADRFLRVRFSDEKFQGRINSTDKETMNEVFTRIKRTMINGISIGDRHFEFLAFGNSQFREHGAYFFAPLPHLTAQNIRAWMGYFGDIKIVAKHAARLGQCFSTTRAINCTRVEIREIQDVERNGYRFTDGVGKISNFLAKLITSELNITTVSGEPPSVFQFRLGGCKGVLAVSPDARMREIHIRPSQYKFPAVHNGLEIIRWSQFAAATLNRQLILVLSALGVEDDVFVRKLKEMLVNLQQAMTDEKMALHLLQKYVDPNQMTMTVAAMIVEGFQHSREPFVTSLLQLWRAWSIKYLKEKAKILIEKGAFLFGCVDETATLKGHFDSQQRIGPDSTDEEWVESLPQIFLQISARKPGGRASVIEGPCLLARNPSLHPGDIRVVRGVNVKALWHLKDVVVLPQSGDRDIAGMCSGGDLDGDDYLVIWDPDMFPKEWNHKPMDYTPPVPVQVEREVTVNDITNFFVTYMKNDRLPTIAHAHLALADYMDLGVKDEKCLKLVSLHSMAVDYVKTGEPAIMPSELHPRRWPHFMEKNHKPKEQVYVSHKVLGKLYDQVERIDFVPCFDNPFDKRILEAYKVDDKMLEDAAAVKQQYDAAMRRIMAQHDIATEFEVWSTFVLHHANQSKDYKFHEEMGEISSALKDRFRQACYEKAGSKEFGIMGPFVAAMYRVTADEMAAAIEECHQVKIVAGKEKRVRHMDAQSMPLMSFPWLFQSILGKIANGEIYPTEVKVPEVAPVVRATAKPTSKRASGDVPVPQAEDTVATTEGVTHRGEVLELFHHEEEQTLDSSRAAKEHGSRKSSGEEHSPEQLTEEQLAWALVDPIPDLKPVHTVEEVPSQTWEGLEKLGAPEPVPLAELGPLIDVGEGSTGLIDIDDSHSVINGGRQVTVATGKQPPNVNMHMNDLLTDDTDLERFNNAIPRGGTISPDLIPPWGTPTSGSGSNGRTDRAINDLLAEYRDGEDTDKRRAQTVQSAELVPVEDDDEGQGEGEGEEVMIHIDPRDSALELLAKLVE